MYSDLQALAPGEPVPPLLWPVHEPAWDGDPDAGTPGGVPEAFHFDPAVYSGHEPFPAALADDQYPVEPLFGGYEGALIELRPFQFDPTTGVLATTSDFEIALDHPAPLGLAPKPVAPRASVPVENFTFNYEEIKFSYAPAAASEGNTTRLLVVAPEGQLDELLPLVEQRQLTGHDVEFRALETLADETAATVRAAVGSWAASAPGPQLNHVILVGDHDVIPLHPALAAGGVASDAPYERPVDGDPSMQVHVGRLSVDDELDLAGQVAKIVATERTMASANDFKQIGLACHELGGDYTSWGTELAAELSSSAAGFTPQLILGHEANATAKLFDLVASGASRVLYRGHGTASSWGAWAGSGPDVTAAGVLGLAGELAPIHWSLAPSTANIVKDDCLAEAWMSSPHGTVAIYGSAGGSQAVSYTHLTLPTIYSV